MTIREAARYLGLSEQTVKGFMRSGALPFRWDDTTGQMSTTQDEVDAFIETCRIRPGTVGGQHRYWRQNA